MADFFATIMTLFPSWADSSVQTLAMIEKALPTFVEGALISTATVIVAMVIGFCAGIPFAVLQVYGNNTVKTFVRLYTWFFRGIPILVLLYLFYFGLAYQLGLDISPFFASCLVLGLTSTAYQSQIVRGSLLSIPEGQLKAAKAVGMSNFQAIYTIILPQACRLSLPGWSNEFSILLKDSALISVLGTSDLMFRARAMGESRASYMTAYLVTAALMYFFITLIGTSLFKTVEKAKRVPGYSQP